MQKRTINEMVIRIQEVGMDNAQVEFSEIYTRLIDNVTDKAFKFLDSESYRHLNIDPYDLVSYAMCEKLIAMIEAWDGRGTFVGYFFRFLPLAFTTAIRPYVRQKNQVNVTAESIDAERPDGKTLADILIDYSRNDFEDDFMDLMNQFADQFGRQKMNVILCFLEEDRNMRNQAICNEFGVVVYDDLTRQKVARTKKDFKKFYESVTKAD